MEIVLKICALALIGALSTTLLRRTLPELSVLTSVVLLGVLATVATGVLSGVTELIIELSSFAGISENIIKPIIKVLGISIITKLATDLCKESGVAASASYIELVGGAVSILIATPYMFELLGQITS